MTIKSNLENKKFGVGDKVKVVQRIFEQSKERRQIFLGTVIGIKGSGENMSITVRRIGENLIGIEKIFPLGNPNIIEVSVTKEGRKGIRRSKLYYTRKQSRKEIERIYSRSGKKKE